MLGPLGLAAQAQDGEEILREPLIEFGLDAARLEDVEILVNDRLVNAFASLEEGRVRLVLPFPERAEAIAVVVRAAETGDELFAQDYRFAPGALFDQESFEVTALETAEHRPHRRLEPSTAEDKYRPADNDILLTGAFSGRREGWSLGADAELAGTTDETRRVRPQDTNVDLQYGRITTGYESEAAGAWLSAGDIDVLSGSALVNEGYRSRGVGLSTSWLDDRLTLSGVSTFGSDIVGFQRGFGQTGRSNRTVADLGLEVVRGENLGVTVTGTFLDAERPASANFGIGEVVEGERNRVAGGGIAIDLFGGRIRTSSEVAYSRYENPAELDPFLSGLPGFVDVGETEGRAHTHRLDVIVWEGESVNVTAYGLYSLTDPLYRSIQSFAPADRETIEFGGTVGWGPAQLGITRTVFENNVDKAPTLLTTETATTLANLGLFLEEYRVPAEDAEHVWPRRLIPSSVNISYSDTRIEDENAGALLDNPAVFFTPFDIPHQVTKVAGLALSWNWEAASTNLALNTYRLDNRPPADTTADTIDDSIDLSQSFFGDIWDLSAHVTASRTRFKQSTSTAKRYVVAPGVNLSLRAEGWPDLAGYADLSWDTTEFDVDGSDSHARTRRVGASLDFSKYLPGPDLESLGRAQPFLVVSWQFQDTKFNDPFFGEQSQISHTAMLTAGFGLGP